jgi:hypothetical protein
MPIIALTGEMIAGRPKTLQSYLWDITLEAIISCRFAANARLIEIGF